VLRTWVEVVDVGGFARAAEQIHLSQPRVSAHIASLERELGCCLIERRVRPLTLTEEGKLLLPRRAPSLPRRTTSLLPASPSKVNYRDR